LFVCGDSKGFQISSTEEMFLRLAERMDSFSTKEEGGAR
jgi:hypothetical protein